MNKFKFWLMAAAMMLSAPAWAQSNSVYMDQIGSGSTVSITQDGSNNAVNTSTNKAKMYGDNLSVTIQQIGANNTMTMDVQTSGVATTVTSTVDGNLNDVTINCGSSGVTLGSCGGATITANATGGMNTMSIDTTGGSTSSMNITGDSNTVAINNTSSNVKGAEGIVTVSGNNNGVTLTQGGAAGTLGHSGTIAVTGNSNTVGVTQGGTIDTKVNVTSTGNSNSITVSTHN
jgi:hypothetical protein